MNLCKFIVFWGGYDAVLRNSSGKLLERCGHNLKPIPNPGIVSKIGLCLGAKAPSQISLLNFPELLLQTGSDSLQLISKL